MADQENCREELEVTPLTQEHWDDLVTLFGRHGASGGCWCMFWRVKRAEYDARRGEGLKEGLKSLVFANEAPGLLAYSGGKAVGWISLGPREQFPRLENSRNLARVDEQAVWSVVCFFVARSHRNQGLTIRLLQAAVEYARLHGAKIVEGYPVDPKQDRVDALSVYTGLASVFKVVGFTEVARRSETRPVMRLTM
jgi:GNAT superfamily N-acetyltransferase